MYIAPELTDLGSFQELTLGAAHMGNGVLGPVGSLVNTVSATVDQVVSDATGINLPGITMDDNTHLGGVTAPTVVDPNITVTAR